MAVNKVLVYGGKGALGQAVAAFFKKHSYVCQVTSHHWRLVIVIGINWPSAVHVTEFHDVNLQEASVLPLLGFGLLLNYINYMMIWWRDRHSLLTVGVAQNVTDLTNLFFHWGWSRSM